MGTQTETKKETKSEKSTFKPVPNFAKVVYKGVWNLFDACRSIGKVSIPNPKNLNFQKCRRQIEMFATKCRVPTMVSFPVDAEGKMEMVLGTGPDAHTAQQELLRVADKVHSI